MHLQYAHGYHNHGLLRITERLVDDLVQGRKGAASKHKLAAGSARRDPKARNITSDRLRAVLGKPDMPDSETETLMASLFALADVTVQAFKQRRRSSELFNSTLVPEASPVLSLGSGAIM